MRILLKRKTMYYKLSNDFVIDDIEVLGSLKFKFPDAYQERPLVDGLNEELLPVILDKNPDIVDFAIWGLLPQNFKEDWSVFQSTGNTLNMDLSAVLTDKVHQDILIQRRCCILVSGFFASFYNNGEVFPVYVYSNKSPVFALAGIYNITNDGFVTTTVLLKESNNYMIKLQNISNRMPITLDMENMRYWLSDEYGSIVYDGIDDFSQLDIKSHTIAKEFYKNNIVYDSILEPVQYQNLAPNF